VPRYRYKCKTTGATYDDKSEALKQCDEENLVEPKDEEYDILEKWLQKVNRYGQTLVELLYELIFDVNVLDNAYVVALYEYTFNKKGEISSKKLTDIIRGDPRYMKLVMNKKGEMGRDNSGHYLYFCPDDRENPIYVEEGEEPPKCKSGVKPFPAYYMYRKIGDTTRIYYAPWEVLHLKKFTPGVGYGYPPIMSILSKVLALMYMDVFIYRAFQSERPPRGILVMRGNVMQNQKNWQAMLEWARRNPHAIMPLFIDVDTKASKLVEWIDLELHPKEFDMIELRREMRRSISAIYGVSPVFYETVSRSAEANSGFIVTNRAVEYEQILLNTKVLPWISQAIGVEGYTYMLKPPERRDVKSELDIKRKTVEIVALLRRMGFHATLRERDDGQWDIVIEQEPPPPTPPDNPEKIKPTLHQGGEEDPERKNKREKERYYTENPPTETPATRVREEDQRFTGEPEKPEGGESG
jgi:hypothetical protein